MLHHLKIREKLLLFPGLCEYYSKFIQNFATKMELLRELTRKNSEFIWSEKQELAFEQIKKDIVNAPILKSFCLNKKCIITVDASCYGLGAVLSQCAGKNEWCIAFASRTLSATERKYAVIEKQLLACTWAVEHYRNYVWGNRFILKIDHKPLVGILSPGGGWNSTARIARLMSKLQEYDFEVIYVPGKSNITADFLSRLPCSDDRVVQDDQDKEVLATVNFVSKEFTGLSEDLWRLEMKGDSMSQFVLKC